MTKQLVHSLYGEPAFRDTRPSGQEAGSKLAPPGGPYIGRNRCIANDDTCEGPKAKGTDYCIGHLRAMEKETDEHNG